MPPVPPTIKQVRPSSRPGRDTVKAPHRTRSAHRRARLEHGLPPLDLKNGLDLHRDSGGQRDHADGTSGPDARVTEYVFHQIGIAVDNLGVLAETRASN